MSTKMQKYPPATKGKVIVWGLMAAMPFGGMIWQVTHHLVGLRRLGFDVWYVEDSHIPCMHPDTWEMHCDYKETARFLGKTMKSVGLKDRWIFRPPKRPDFCVGARDNEGLKALYKEADVVFNLCGAHKLREDHDDIKCLVLLQTDPVAPQLSADKGSSYIVDFLSRHDYLFTYAENLGKPCCNLPTAGFNWLPTRPPVIVDWWDRNETVNHRAHLTTVANWHNKGFNIEWKGKVYRWEKHLEYKNFVDLPADSELPLEIASVGMPSDDTKNMTAHGWEIRSAKNLSDATDYRDYIQDSFGEFSVVKEQYWHFYTGWFSDRSACYLAAGNPVITRETGFSEVLPSGEGLLPYTTSEEAISAIAEISGKPAVHRNAAKALANEFFDAENVLANVASSIGLL